jgi:hypothetical protein
VFLSSFEFKYFWLVLIYAVLVGNAHSEARAAGRTEASPTALVPVVR